MYVSLYLFVYFILRLGLPEAADLDMGLAAGSEHLRKL